MGSPNLEKQFFKSGTILRGQLGEPFALDLAEHLHSCCVCGESALRKVDNACAALIRRVGSDVEQARAQVASALVDYGDPDYTSLLVPFSQPHSPRQHGHRGSRIE